MVFSFSNGHRTRTHINGSVRWTLLATSANTGGFLNFLPSARGENANRVLYRKGLAAGAAFIRAILAIFRVMAVQTAQHIVAFVAAAFDPGVFTVSGTIVSLISG